MITLKDINKAIVTQVKEGLRDTPYVNVGFSSTDIEKSIIRPSFYVEFLSNKTGRFNANNKERTLHIQLFYFPTMHIKNKMEILEVEGLLEDVFIDSLKINDNFIIPINEVDFDITDGTLIANIELYTIEEIEDTDTIPLMDTLDINL